MPSTAPPGGRPQPDRDRHGLLVVQQQRRHGGTGLQLVPAGHAPVGVDRISQLAQPVHVAAERPRADFEPLGQLGARPVPVGLQQRQQPQHPSTRIRHVQKICTRSGQKVAGIAHSVTHMTEAMIHTNGLTRHFTVKNETVTAVAGLDLHVEPGELVALLGPNGAGKSTTLRMLTTLLAPTSGTARVAGFDVTTEQRAVRNRIGYIGQGNGAGHSQRGRDELVSQGRAYG